MNQYPLPTGWRWAKLGEVLEFQQYGISQKANCEKAGYPILGMGNIKGGKLDLSGLKYAELPKLEPDKYTLRKGDILINRTNSAELVGKSAVFDLEGDYVFASYLIRLRVKELKADPYFINFGINSFIGRDYVLRVARRAIGQANINSREISEMPIPICSISEQRRIAAKIQELMQDVDRARAACENQLEAAKALLAAYLRSVFESEEAKKWQKKKIGEVIREALPGFACGKRAGTEGVVQLRMNNISSDGRIDLSSLIRIPATQAQIDKYSLFRGDVIINNTNSVELVGKSALFNEEGVAYVYSNHLTRLRPVSTLLSSDYLALWLHSLWVRRVFELICNRWIGQAAVQRDKLLSLEIPLPPLPEQRRIGAKIKELMQDVDRARAACEKQLGMIDILPQKILEKAFRGRL